MTMLCIIMFAFMLLQPLSGLPIKSISFGNSSQHFHKISYYQNNNYIYIGGTNIILQLNAEKMILIANLTIGPQQDNLHCLPNPQPCPIERISTNNEIKVLIASATKLIYCGSINQGMCEIIDLGNSRLLNGSKMSIGNERDPENYIGGKGSVSVFASNGMNSNNRKVFYSALSYDGRPVKMMPYQVSSRVLIEENSKFRWLYASVQENSVTGIKFKDDYQSKFIVNYIHGFAYGHFSYFLTTQRVSLNSPEYETRLIRVNKHDKKYFSYMEIPLVCERSNANIATAAYLGEAQPHVLTQEYTADEDALFVSFKNSRDTFKPSEGPSRTSICVYPISKIIDSFSETIKNCLRSSDNKLSMLPWIQGSNDFCTSSQSDIDENFGGSNYNKYIEGKSPIKGTFLMSISQLVTMLITVKQNKKIVGFLGTNQGELLKVFLKSKKDASFILKTMPLADGLPMENRAVQKSKVIDKKNEELFVLTGNKLSKISVSSCTIYTSCEECVTIGVKDPLGCKWCGSFCARKDECPKTSDWENICQPIIESFSPHSGPLEGSTSITILGDYFKSSLPKPKAKLNVSFERAECVVKLWERKRIICETLSTPYEYNSTITVMLKDFGSISTHSISKETFNFVKIVPVDFKPSYGPFDGGTNITIYGNNFDSGSKRHILVAGIECKEFRAEFDKIECSSGEINMPHMNATVSGPVIIKIDNSTVSLDHKHFTYKLNPEIQNIHPKVSVLSGGDIINITGEYFDSVTKSQMIVMATTFLDPQQLNFITDCHIISSHAMQCPSPNLDLVRYHPDAQSPLRVHLSFVMDGVKKLRNLYDVNEALSRFHYYPNPTYKPFHHGTKYIDESSQYLYLEGENLDLVHNIEHINIRIGMNETCKVTALSLKELTCEIPPYLTNEKQGLKIEIFSGNLTFKPGVIMFNSAKSASIIIPIITGLLSALFVLLLLIVVLYRRKKKRQYPKKKQELSVKLTQSIKNNDSECNNKRFQESPLIPKRGKYLEIIQQVETDGFLINFQYLEIGQIIGQGHFGCVCHGTLTSSQCSNSKDVAVKRIKQEYVAEVDLEAFLEEAIIMKDFEHKNVLTLIGVSLDPNGLPVVVTPFMKYGDLLSYIRNEENHPTVKELVQFGIQIAEGMEYLSGLKFVHRDLAARNCMVDADLTIKVADFGLSRDVYERAYYSSENNKTKLPVKWMAIESLEKGLYSTKSDVWSFGVVLWELLTRGVCPYPDVDNWEVIRYLKSGRRLPQSSHCPDLLYAVMFECWSENIHARPPFVELVKKINAIINDLEQRRNETLVELNVTYANFTHFKKIN